MDATEDVNVAKGLMNALCALYLSASKYGSLMTLKGLNYSAIVYLNTCLTQAPRVLYCGTEWGNSLGIVQVGGAIAIQVAISQSTPASIMWQDGDRGICE